MFEIINILHVEKRDDTRNSKTDLSDGALNISNDGSIGIIDELDSDLNHVTSVTGAAQNLVDLSELHVGVLDVKTTTIEKGNAKKLQFCQLLYNK